MHEGSEDPAHFDVNTLFHVITEKHVKCATKIQNNTFVFIKHERLHWFNSTFILLNHSSQRTRAIFHAFFLNGCAVLCFQFQM